MRIVFYLIAIVMANVITAKFAPLFIGVFIIPWGTFLIGATFILRDLVQMKHGKKNTYITICVALALSAASSYLLGDTLWISFASLVSFLFSETVDTEIFSRLKTTITKRVLISGVVGGSLDSTIFVVLGLSPLGAGFLPWVAVPMAILGQMIIKSLLQAVGSGVMSFVKSK